MKIEQLGAHIGARIHDVDVSQPLSDRVVSEIKEAFLEHLVLLFPNQPLTPRQLMTFGELFGELEPPHPLIPSHPDEPQVIVVFNDEDHPPENNIWHTDVTWKRTPPLGAVLHAQVLPPTGGDTLWVSMNAVYEALTEAEKVRFEGLRAVHSIETFAGGNEDYGDGGRVQAAIDQYPPLQHPMIRTHPQTGIRSVFVNAGFTTHIAEVDAQDSQAIMARIAALVDRPEFQLRVQWEPLTLAIWDNRCTQHQAAADYFPQFRKMHRVTIVGDEPRLVPV